MQRGRISGAIEGIPLRRDRVQATPKLETVVTWRSTDTMQVVQQVLHEVSRRGPLRNRGGREGTIRPLTTNPTNPPTAGAPRYPSTAVMPILGPALSWHGSAPTAPRPGPHDSRADAQPTGGALNSGPRS